MKKRISTLTAVLLSIAMLFSFASCSSVEEEGDEFVAATLAVNEDIPVSESEIIAFYNNIITELQKADSFTSENKPGINLSESLSAGGINVLSYNAATGEASEDSKLDALKGSANAIKNRIIGGIKTDSTIIGFGDTSAPFTTIIHPGTGVSSLTESDFVSAECYVDGYNLYITIKLAGTLETVENIFGVRDKSAVLASFNEYSAEYAEVTDYSVEYIEDAENDTYSTIKLQVEVEQQEDGTYKCTGRIMNLDIQIICDVAANVTCKGSFADNGDIQVQFRFTDRKFYEFDWLGTSTWEPSAEDSSDEA